MAAALLQREGHAVVGVTMRLWGGDSDTGCCSVSDVDDARRCADELGVEHLVFNLSEAFDRYVVEPYVAAHAEGMTPNPCIECNRRVKFATFAEQARLLGFEAVATGHHAQVAGGSTDPFRFERGADRAKDQSYVVHMLTQHELARTLFPVGAFQKSEVRRLAAELGLRTAAKPDSQDVCFITSTGGRAEFLRRRIPMTSARVVDTRGRGVGTVPAIELMTVGQRKGIGLPGGGPKRFVLAVDRATSTVVVGDESELLDDGLAVGDVTWVDRAVEGEVLVQTSAHGAPRRAVIVCRPDEYVDVCWLVPERRVAEGQSVVFYDRTDRYVLGGGTVPRSGPTPAAVTTGP